MPYRNAADPDDAAAARVRRMDELIPVINQLQDVFNTVGEAKMLNLPQIVVVGAQSSGKSSVLENIVGRDFLPRGTGIVTRVPLVMQLINVPPPEHRSYSSVKALPDHSEWAEFLHRPNEVFSDFEAVRNEIEAQTERLVGDQKNVSDAPINLKVFSPHVLNLTLVDLPGITKVPVADQPADIEKQIRDLVLRYISNPNSIVLAVSPANVDMANSDSLKIAREVDPEGTRTIAVVTKLDLMDRGTNALDVLNGKVVRVKLGVIGVVNRSQYDINQRKSIRDAVRSEELFFEQHYPSLKHRCGTTYLAKALNKLLMNHIRDCLPELRARIKEMQINTESLLGSLGKPLGSDSNKGALLLQFLTSYTTAFTSSIDGSSSAGWDTDTDRSHAQLSGGAMICHIFHSTFTQTLNGLGALEGLTTADIRAAIQNSTGTRPALFVPEMAFEILVKKQIERLRDPGMRCVELVFQELERLMYHCASHELSRFRVLRERVVEATAQVLRERLPETRAMIESLIAIELAYINTNHRDFEGGAGAMVKLISRLQAEEARVATPSPATRQDQADGAKPRSKHGTGQSAGGAAAAGGPQGDRSPSRTPGPLADPATPAQQQSETRSYISSFLWGRGHGAQAIDGGSAPAVPATPTILSTTTREDYITMVQTPTHFPSPMNRSTFPVERLSGREQVEVDLVTNLIESYFNIVRDKVVDSVPKAIMHFLVNYVTSALQNEMVTTLWQRELFDELLQEDPLVESQRTRAAEMLAALNRAFTIVNEVSMM